MCVPIDIRYLRSLFLKHKKFLSSIFTSNPTETKHILEAAERNQLLVLLRFLYLIVQEAIPLEQHLGESLGREKKIKLLQLFLKQNSFKRILHYSNFQNRKLLLYFKNELHFLLTPLFKD